MGDTLPTSRPPDPVHPLLISDPVVPDIHPAIEALMGAYKKGLIDTQDVIDTLTVRPKQSDVALQKADEDIQASKGRMELKPGEITLAKAQNKSALDILPGQTQSTIDVNDLSHSIFPQKKEAAGNVANAMLPETRLAADEAQQDPDGTLGLTQARHAYQEMYGAPLMSTNADGTDGTTLDYAGMRNAVKQAGAATMSMKMQNLMFSSPAWKQVFETAQKTGREDILSQGLSSGKSATDILNELGKAPSKMPPEQAQAEMGKTLSIEKTLGDIYKGRGYLSKNPNLVGPAWNQGTAVGQALPKIGAFFGGDQEKTRQQSELDQLIANSVVATARDVGGRMFTKEIEQLEKGRPSLTNPPETWNAWLDQSEDLLRRAYAAKKQALPGNTADTIKAGSQAGQDGQVSTGLPTAVEAQLKKTLPPGKSLQWAAGLPVHDSLAEVQPGTWFKFSDGTVGFKPPGR